MDGIGNKSTDFSQTEKNYKIAGKIAEEVKKAGGRAFFVGGSVRDRLLGIINTDIDIEIHCISTDLLEAILDKIGDRIEFGKSFGIYGLKGFDVDIAMPRTEKATGKGHRDFKVNVDPFIGLEKAAKRRDFTINAMMEDVLTGEIVDCFDGRRDLEKGKIRHVSDETFGEDPLRVLRAAQFASRFDFFIDEDTMNLCRNMDISGLSMERVAGETAKALLMAPKPSKYFETLRCMNKLSYWFCETENLIGVPQSIKHHQEGDVWTHTMMVLDQAAKRKGNVENKLGFMYGALCHDFGKAITTEEINGQIHAYNHEKEGLKLIENFMSRLTNEKDLIEYVLNMAGLHMKPGRLTKDNCSIKSTNKLMDDSICPNDLFQLAASDGQGMIPPVNPENMLEFMGERYELYKEIMSRPYVMGRDLISAGLKPDRNFTEILEFAHKLRLAGIPKEDALKQTLGYSNKFYVNKQ